MRYNVLFRLLFLLLAFIPFQETNSQNIQEENNCQLQEENNCQLSIINYQR